MNEEKKNLPKPTPEALEEYEKLSQVLNGIDETTPVDEINTASMKMNQLQEQYDWSDIAYMYPWITV